MTPSPAPDPAPDAWTTSLEEPVVPEPPDAGAPAVRGPAPLALAALAAVVLAVALAAVSVIVSRSPEPSVPAPPVPPILGSRLAVPLRMPVPDGGVVTADVSYVGVQVPGSGAILVTVPTGVSDAEGVRSPLPADPATWLRRNPQVLVTGVREFQVGSVTATQVDYRRSTQATPVSQFSRLSLFCGWSRSADAVRDAGRGEPCTGITPAARVRATFIPVGGRTVLFEAIWRDSDSTGAQMPRELRRSYRALLTQVRPGR
jgi:hypothetical protein